MRERVGRILLNEFILSPSEKGNDSRLPKVFLRNDLELKSWHLIQFEGVQKNAPGKKAPRKKPPRKLPPEDMPPRKIVPWKIAPRKNAPRTIAPWVIVLLDFRCFWHYLRVVYFKTFCSFRGVTRTPATSIIDLLVTVANSIN